MLNQTIRTLACIWTVFWSGFACLAQGFGVFLVLLQVVRQGTLPSGNQLGAIFVLTIGSASAAYLAWQYQRSRCSWSETPS
jgi:drug/metabolite transporter (DMT)-like permease